MAAPVRSLGAHSAPTFDQVFIRLLLWTSPFVGGYLVLMMVLAITVKSWWAGLLILLVGFTGLVIMLRALGGWIVEVPFLQALIISRWDNHRLEALRTGFYIRPSMVYKRLAQVSLRPSEGERIVENVALRGGPPLTIRVAYTLRPNLPLHTNILPRTHLDDAIHEHDVKIIGFMFLAHNLPERWAIVSGNVIERELRTFLGGLKVLDIYDPAGAEIEYGGLIRWLNEYMAPILEKDLGFTIQIHSLEVRDGNNAAALEWRRRLAQMQQLTSWTHALTMDQLLMLLPTFQRISGDTSGMGMDPWMMLLFMQMNGGPGGNSPLGPMGMPRQGQQAIPWPPLQRNGRP